MAEPPRQPRPAKDLPGLLKFCMEATASEDAPNPSSLEEMDPERRRWLEEALANMTVDVIKQLTDCIKLLNDPAVRNPDATEEELSQVESALDVVNDFVDNMDMANNFHKLGGFGILRACLVSPHTTIRQRAAGVTAELAQNNPYCQENLVADGFIPTLINMLDKDAVENVRFKALSAISCLIRDNPAGQKEFLDLNGCSVLLRSILTSETRLRIKACFFLSAVNEENPEFKEAFSSMGMSQQLVDLLQREHEQSHEHVAKALLTLLRDNPPVIDEVRHISGVKDFLLSRIDSLKDQEEFEEEREHYQNIFNICFEPKDSSAEAASPDR